MTEPTVTLQQNAQSLSPDAFVSLFALDATILGGPILRFASTAEADGSPVVWEGNEYPALNFTLEGFAWDGDTMPRPRITASIASASSDGALGESFLEMAVAYKGGQGATLTRVRTLVRYLDGHTDGGQGICFMSDVYKVDRIVSLDKYAISWELIAPLDMPNSPLPARKAVRDTCGWIYRRYNAATGTFIYNNTTCACPYTGTACFDKAGIACASSDDECGRRLTDCVLRYGEGAALPFGGFPGVARVR